VVSTWLPLNLRIAATLMRGPSLLSPVATPPGSACNIVIHPRGINWLSARIIINSHALFDEFSKSIPGHKLRVVYCAVEVSNEPGLPVMGMRATSRGRWARSRIPGTAIYTHVTPRKERERLAEYLK